MFFGGNMNSVCTRSLELFYIVSYCIKRIMSSWTNNTYQVVQEVLPKFRSIRLNWEKRLFGHTVLEKYTYECEY